MGTRVVILESLDCCSNWRKSSALGLAVYIPHFGGVELAQFGIAKENAVHFLVHLFEADLFVADDFANKSSALTSANVSAVVHPPRLFSAMV
jgi:hypothetical protein